MTWKTEEHVGNGIRTKIWRSSGSTASVRADRSVHQRVTLAHDLIPVRRLASKINRILGPGFREEVARLSHKGRSVVAVLDSWKTLGAANKNPSLEIIRALGESERRQLVSRWAEEDGYRDPRYMLHQAFEAVLNMTRFFSPSTVKTLTDEGVNVDAGEVHELLCSPAFFDSYAPTYMATQNAATVIKRGMSIRQEQLLRHYDILRRNSASSNIDAAATAVAVNASREGEDPVWEAPEVEVFENSAEQAETGEPGVLNRIINRVSRIDPAEVTSLASKQVAEMARLTDLILS